MPAPPSSTPPTPAAAGGRGRRLLVWLASAACLVAGIIAEAVRAPWQPLRVAVATPPAVQNPGSVVLSELSKSLIDMPPDTPSAHASALTVLPGDHMLAFWWAGSRESGADVQVYLSRWSEGDWGPAQAVVDRERLGRALGFAVRRIGNPAAWAAPDGRIHLYVVATGLGGWAASRVVHLVSADQGRHFEVRRVLPLSPLFNTSVLVRTTPVGLPDGGWWLPTYFELGNKYSMLLAFDRDGEPRWMTRIGERTTAFQPAVVQVTATETRAWMRDISLQRRVQQAVSHDGGETWEDLPPVDLPNHDSSVAALRLREGGFVLLYNEHVAGETSPRSRLRLAVSTDARHWSPGTVVVNGAPMDEFSYPSVQQVGKELHVTYTDQRRAIAHHVYRIDYPGAVR